MNALPPAVSTHSISERRCSVSTASTTAPRTPPLRARPALARPGQVRPDAPEAPARASIPRRLADLAPKDLTELFADHLRLEAFAPDARSQLGLWPLLAC